MAAGNTDKKFDVFDYEIKRITYQNSYTSGGDLLRCVFIINGKDILEIVREAAKELDYFHHTTLSDLWAFDLSDPPYIPGRIHPLICSCDELGCGNISITVTENEDGVVWNNFHHGDAMSDDEEDVDIADSELSFEEDLKLSFEFEKNDYKRKMEEIKKLSCALCGR